jgi:hypothetical protein
VTVQLDADQRFTTGKLGEMVDDIRREHTMDRIAKDAEARAQILLDLARQGLATAEKALGEAAGSPIFGNGIAKELRDQYEAVRGTDKACQNLKIQISKRFRGEAE